MRGKILVYALPALILTMINLAGAQQPKNVPRIGYLSSTSPSAGSSRIEAFRQGLRSLDTSKEKTSLSSGDLQRENSIAYLRSRLS
jgi:hypothetical protein